MELSIEHIHFYKSIFKEGKMYTKQIDSYIGKIRAIGRQEYFGGQTDGFSRIVHDYSDERKEFVIWKDMLEERLI